ncbi:uncharacterized protein LY89DRAFT_759114 [Mollisia scopiformis]|uniref:Uncharacterized protein n=1 Tax=Mollisia scopiformis TaxID=149040 RepID=A0A194WTG6_MOLSC|nr:uncharacterized protein LY89DRAFT_759114 [Mollisia scopiformis]KUJ11256.1 hypothetical protein LY89DRAFT_759114 [Mollisia scopiformis]
MSSQENEMLRSQSAIPPFLSRPDSGIPEFLSRCPYFVDRLAGSMLGEYHEYLAENPEMEAHFGRGNPAGMTPDMIAAYQEYLADQPDIGNPRDETPERESPVVDSPASNKKIVLIFKKKADGSGYWTVTRDITEDPNDEDDGGLIDDQISPEPVKRTKRKKNDVESTSEDEGSISEEFDDENDDDARPYPAPKKRQIANPKKKSLKRKPLGNISEDEEAPDKSATKSKTALKRPPWTKFEHDSLFAAIEEVVIKVKRSLSKLDFETVADELKKLLTGKAIKKGVKQGWTPFTWCKGGWTLSQAECQRLPLICYQGEIPSQLRQDSQGSLAW